MEENMYNELYEDLCVRGGVAFLHGTINIDGCECELDYISSNDGVLVVTYETEYTINHTTLYESQEIGFNDLSIDEQNDIYEQLIG